MRPMDGWLAASAGLCNVTGTAGHILTSSRAALARFMPLYTTAAAVVVTSAAIYPKPQIKHPSCTTPPASSSPLSHHYSHCNHHHYYHHYYYSHPLPLPPPPPPPSSSTTPHTPPASPQLLCGATPGLSAFNPRLVTVSRPQPTRTLRSRLVPRIATSST